MRRNRKNVVSVRSVILREDAVLVASGALG